MMHILTDEELKEHQKELIEFTKKNQCLMWNHMIMIQSIRNEGERDTRREKFEETRDGCDHDWVYEKCMLLSNPPQVNKICKKCGQSGRDRIGSLTKFEDSYEGVAEKFSESHNKSNNSQQSQECGNTSKSCVMEKDNQIGGHDSDISDSGDIISGGVEDHLPSPSPVDATQIAEEDNNGS